MFERDMEAFDRIRLIAERWGGIMESAREGYASVLKELEDIKSNQVALDKKLSTFETNILNFVGHIDGNIQKLFPDGPRKTGKVGRPRKYPYKTSSYLDTKSVVEAILEHLKPGNSPHPRDDTVGDYTAQKLENREYIIAEVKHLLVREYTKSVFGDGYTKDQYDHFASEYSIRRIGEAMRILKFGRRRTYKGIMWSPAKSFLYPNPEHG